MTSYKDMTIKNIRRMLDGHKIDVYTTSVNIKYVSNDSHIRVLLLERFLKYSRGYNSSRDKRAIEALLMYCEAE